MLLNNSMRDDTESCTIISQEIKTQSFKCALLSSVLEVLSGAREMAQLEEVLAIQA